MPFLKAVKEQYMISLKGKKAIITGGANGIGKATALKFITAGARVAIVDMDPKGKDLCAEWRAAGSDATYYKCDISQHQATLDCFALIVKEMGGVDILINNAGITRDASLKKMTIDQWQQVIDVNLTGVFNCTKAVMPYMADQLGGRIINASSVVGLYGNFGQTNYVATKAGVIGLTKTWARELGKYNITVNAVAPGFISTEMINAVPEKVLDMMKEKSALKRLGEVDDIANAYLYLASDMASFITGTTLSVDGGLIV